VVERCKANQMRGRMVNTYFWRTYDQKEIDYLEESGGRLEGYEFKWQETAPRRAVRNEFLRAYPDASLTVIHRDNFTDFLS